MNAANEAAPLLRTREEGRALSLQWRTLSRAATIVALVSSPAVAVYVHHQTKWGWLPSMGAALAGVVVFRGMLDLLFRKFIPWPTLFGVEDRELVEEDVVNRRRAWHWHWWLMFAIGLLLLNTLFWVIFNASGTHVSWAGSPARMGNKLHNVLPLLGILPFYFLFNFLIFMGPMLLMGISQIRGFEPGDADWGVKLDDVRGQAEAKEEVRRVVNLWQAGQAFEKAGGKRERGLLFLGAPGTGKTMLAKAIATGFNSPIVTIPGSGFAQTFIGMDAVIVRWLAWKAKRLARKWGGQCIVFIDEIDAVGMRRSALGAPTGRMAPPDIHDHLFFGPWGALNPSGDLILETRAWRERLFAYREPPRPRPSLAARLNARVDQAFPGMFGGGGGQLALNQLLVVMDGIDNPRLSRRLVVNKVNKWLDASYFAPRQLGGVRLRLPHARPSSNQIYFIGATNVPLEALDPALTRPGRMGRHVHFRTPTKKDREDVFDLYLAKVDHDPELDRPERRDELARITSGYSPAMIDQVCSMALTYAHHDLKERFEWEHIVEAMTTVESGTAIGVQYIPEETRAVAIHEAGHAACGHLFLKGAESTRLSIKMRGGSLGHHQASEKEERFSRWRSEEMAYLVWTLGAMAAEHVFYGETGNGVGGDLASATYRAAYMVGLSGMGPTRIELNGHYKTDAQRELAVRRMKKRFQDIGNQLLNRASGDFQHDAVASVLSDRFKRNVASEIMGQAYVEAYNTVRANKPAVERIAETLTERQELYGNELVALLDAQHLKKPELDLTEEETWPTL